HPRGGGGQAAGGNTKPSGGQLSLKRRSAPALPSGGCAHAGIREAKAMTGQTQTGNEVVDGVGQAPDGGTSRLLAAGPSVVAKLISLFRRYRRRLVLAYGLLILENALRLAQPVVMGV